MENNYILPFLWLRDQTEEVLRKEIEKIYDCGIRAVCLESRPHPDFAGPGWWHDFDIVLDEAKKRGMKIWILDDAHFPTGMANGLIPEKYPERARKYAMMQFTDCVGPITAANLDVNLMMTKQFTWIDFGKKTEKPVLDRQELISVTAVRLDRGDTIDSEILDITGSVKDGWLTWDVPEGTWRICVSFTTYDFGANNNYINYVDRESVSTLIEAVYELHYEHYKEEFGKTIAGFFSDEPGFYNVGGYIAGNAIGRKSKMPLPWGAELQSVLESRDPEWRRNLPLLWLDSTDKEKTAEERYLYMDVVSQMYSKNFSCQLGDWCREHGVEYIGHVIEDFDEHSRLGLGTGHYYRAMKGQAMAGIDDIGGQIIPGNPHAKRHGVTSDSDGEFYHYALVKMGASAAQIDPAKRGRLMCECFGAYGWNFGVSKMKWLTNFLLVQGVNHLVPHAFSMAEYPDIDCPPHFYARGNNPEYPYFAELMKYANRLCDLLNGGRNVPQAAIIYPGEHDWMNESMKIQTPAEKLMCSQIDFELIPVDVFENREYYGVSMQNGILTVNGRSMKAIIVPETDYIEEKEARALAAAAEADIPVIFVNRKPSHLIGSGSAEDVLAGAQIVSEDSLVSALRAIGCSDAVCEKEEKDLVAYHYRKNQDIYCFFNTSLSKSVDTDITLPVSGPFVRYDAMSERKFRAGNDRIHLHIEPYEMVVLMNGEEEAEEQIKYDPASAQKADISSDWKVSRVRAIDYPNFSGEVKMEKLVPFSSIDPGFSGIIRYEKEIETECSGRTCFSAQHIYEAAELFVNGKSAGKKINAPFNWDITELVKDGVNSLVIETANSPVREARKAFSPFGPEREMMEPSGMFGKIQLIRYR